MSIVSSSFFRFTWFFVLVFRIYEYNKLRFGHTNQSTNQHTTTPKNSFQTERKRKDVKESNMHTQMLKLLLLLYSNTKYWIQKKYIYIPNGTDWCGVFLKWLCKKSFRIQRQNVHFESIKSNMNRGTLCFIQFKIIMLNRAQFNVRIVDERRKT